MERRLVTAGDSKRFRNSVQPRADTEFEISSDVMFQILREGLELA